MECILMLMNLYYNTQKTDSKCNWVMDSLIKGWPLSRPIRDRQYHGGPSSFWGFIDANWSLIQEHQKWGDDWYFWDMPYYGRWSGLAKALGSKDFYWRVSKNDVHPTKIIKRPSDRFNKWGVEIQNWKTNGSFILVAPSSDTMTRWCTGLSAESWVTKTVNELQKHTDREIRVRHKPRAKGTSGPDAAKLSGLEDFKQAMDGAWAVVTSVSMCAVEAQLAGVPTFCCKNSGALPVSLTKLSKIEQPLRIDREEWLYHLAYSQFTHKEIENGYAYEIIND